MKHEWHCDYLLCDAPVVKIERHVLLLQYTQNAIFVIFVQFATAVICNRKLSYSAGQEMPGFHEIRRSITVITKPATVPSP
jgi:hypothetical protein